MAATPETKFKAVVKKLLKKCGVWYFLPVSRGLGIHGIPDFICCVPVKITPEMVGKEVGLFLGIETKAPGKEATKRQKLIIKEITDAKGLAFDIRPVELPLLAELLAELQGPQSYE